MARGREVYDFVFLKKSVLILSRFFYINYIMQFWQITYLLKKLVKHVLLNSSLAPSGEGNQMLIELEVCQEILHVITCNPCKSFLE